MKTIRILDMYWNTNRPVPVLEQTVINTFAATDVLTRPSLKLSTMPGTFQHVLCTCIYDYICYISVWRNLVFRYNWPGRELI